MPKKTSYTPTKDELAAISRISGTQHTADALRNMNESMVDTEFAADVAGRMGMLGYAPGVVDPSVAQYVGTHHNNELSEAGVFTPETNSYPYRDTIPSRFPGEPTHTPFEVPQGTLAVYGVHAQPQTWTHEYLHKAFPDASEKDIRARVAYSAPTKAEWDKEVAHYARTYKMTKEKADAELANRIRRGHHGFNRADFAKGARGRKPEAVVGALRRAIASDSDLPAIAHGIDAHKQSYVNRRTENEQ